NTTISALTIVIVCSKRVASVGGTPADRYLVRICGSNIVGWTADIAPRPDKTKDRCAKEGVT
ncbi:MAG: hypothetical protein WA418_32625, partial [Bradyrhizobium sp.]